MVPSVEGSVNVGSPGKGSLNVMYHKLSAKWAISFFYRARGVFIGKFL